MKKAAKKPTAKKPAAKKEEEVLIIGKPAKSVSAKVRSAVAGAVSRVKEISEAHLAAWYEPAQMKQPEQVLIVGFKEKGNPHKAMVRLMKELDEALPKGPAFPAFPLHTSDGLLAEIRKIGCGLTLTAPKATKATAKKVTAKPAKKAAKKTAARRTVKKTAGKTKSPAKRAAKR